MKKWVLCVILACFTALIHAEKPVRDVGIGLYINDITKIQAHDEIVDLDVTVFLRWQSEQTFESTQYYYGNQVDEVLKKIWWPYFKFLQARSSTVSSLKSMTISPGGQVDYRAKFQINIETTLDMHQFPFDTQKFNISIEPFGNMPYSIHYYLLEDTIGFGPSAHLTEWKLIGANSKITGHKPMQYQLAIEYQRQAGYYFYKILFPLFMIVFISYLVLWLPKQPAINRLAVIITAMLTIVAFQWAVTNDVPKVSYITYFQSLLLLAFFSLGLNAVFIVFGESISSSRRQQLIFWAKLLFPVFLLIGFCIITFLWFKVV